MTPSLIDDAVRAVSRLRDARHIGSFRHAVREFVKALASVPDEQAGALSEAGIQALQSLGEDVIDLIEERVSDIPHASDAQELVGAVYEIRRLLEEASRWRQHYAYARPV
jgi:hypothetical protein